MKIADGVYMVSNPIPSYMRTINCYLLEDGADCYLVDTGWPPETAQAEQGNPTKYDGWQLIMQLFAEAGRNPEQLSGIILTHYHPDHMGYVRQLQQYTHAPLLLSSYEVQENAILCGDKQRRNVDTLQWYIRNGLPAELRERCMQLDIRYEPIPDHSVQMLSDGQHIRIGQMDWEVIWTPGHTWGHICLYERSRGIVLTGDHILPFNRTIFVSEPCLYTLRANPLGAYLWSLDRMAGIDAKIGLSAHGEVMDNFPATLAKLLSHTDRRYADILNVLQNTGRTVYEIACSIPWMGGQVHFLDIPRFFDLWMALIDTANHIYSLQARGLVEPYQRDGLEYWQLTGRAEWCYDGIDPRIPV